MTNGWVWEALFGALWTAGSAMVCTVLIRNAAKIWAVRKQRHIMLGPVRPVKRIAYRDLPMIQRLADAMEIAGIRAPVEAVIGSMLFIGVFAWISADIAVDTMKLRFALDADKAIAVNTWVLNTVIAVLLGSLPYFYVLFRLQRIRHRMAMDMIKLVQNVIGHYHVNLTVQELIIRSAPTIPEHLREEWKRLEVSSHMGTSLEEALYDFARRTDNEWAEDLADILLLKHTYGNDVIEALHKLVLDMQSAKKHEERRLSMVAVYRVGTCVMIAFAFLIVLFNIYADGANYRHYFVNPLGQGVMLISGIVLFGSLIMVVKSGRRQF